MPFAIRHSERSEKMKEIVEDQKPIIKRLTILFVFVLVVISAVGISRALDNKQVITGTEATNALSQMDTGLEFDIFIIVYASEDKLILHCPKYLVTMIHGNNGWRVDSLVNLKAIKCDIMQASSIAVITPDVNGEFVTIMNSGGEDEWIVGQSRSVFLYNTINRKLVEYPDRKIPDSLHFKAFNIEKICVSPTVAKRKFSAVERAGYDLSLADFGLYSYGLFYINDHSAVGLLIPTYQKNTNSNFSLLPNKGTDHRLVFCEAYADTVTMQKVE